MKFRLPSLYSKFHTRAMTFMVGSGLSYSLGSFKRVLHALIYLGALIYATRTPDLFPRVFGFHELFHVFVILGGSSRKNFG